MPKSELINDLNLRALMSSGIVYSLEKTAMSKLKIWKEESKWEEAEEQWDRGAKAAMEKKPLKTLRCLPKMEGITTETAKGLNWKSLKYMITHDDERAILRGFLKHPFRYGYSLIKSFLSGKPHLRDDDFFLYGIDDVDHFKRLLEEEKTFLVVGFSYCHKPFECPSGRFTDACIRDPENSICRQCFIGKALNALPEERSLPLAIPTIHYIGKKIFDTVHAHPDKKVLFIITACELTLEMFGHWGNMVGIQGIGVRLDGRICNTMKAFEYSEKGIKPGLTIVLSRTQERILELIRHRRERV